MKENKLNNERSTSKFLHCSLGQQSLFVCLVCPFCVSSFCALMQEGVFHFSCFTLLFCNNRETKNEGVACLAGLSPGLSLSLVHLINLSFNHSVDGKLSCLCLNLVHFHPFSLKLCVLLLWCPS